jgi:catecholate siderophore receptor
MPKGATASFGAVSGSIAAAMLVASPAIATDVIDASDADDSRETVVVSGKREREDVSLGTVRGPIIDIPQVISVVSADTLKQQQVVSLEQALRNVAGVTTQIGEGGVANGDQFFIRGQSAKNDIFTDGLRDFGSFTRDSFNYESIEVLKGSSSTALGRGLTGGGINTTSKVPHEGRAVDLGFSGGTDNYMRGTVDANLPMNDRLAFRVNLMAHENDAVDRDVVNSERWGIAPSMSFAFGENSRLTAIYLHQHEERVPDYGVPIAVTTDANDIERPVTELGVDRATFYGFADSDRDDVDVDTLTVKFAYDFSDTFKLTSDTKIGRYDRVFQQSIPSCAAATCGNLLVDGNDATVPIASISPRLYEQSTDGGQNITSLVLTKPLGSKRNELVVGWDVSYQTLERTQYTNGANVTKDLLTPVNSGSAVLPGTLANTRESTGTDFALFVDNRFWFTSTLSLDVGVRFQHFVNDTDQTNFAATACSGVAQPAGLCVETLESEHDLVSPKASFVWEPSELVSAYVSYSRAAVPPGNAIANGDALSSLNAGGSISRNDLDPERTETFDLGVKASLLDRRLLIQSSIYQVDRSNATEIDPVSSFMQYSPEPKQRLRGFELGVTGAISDSLRLSANYAYTDAEIVEAFTGTSGATGVVIDTLAIGKQVRFVPKQSASLWSHFAPQDGALKGFEVGAGLTYQSEIFLDSRNTQATPSFVTVDFLAAYQFGRYRIAVNGYNLADETFYSQVHGGRVLPGAGRSVIANFGVRF